MVSEHCKITLGAPLSQERCLDFREARRLAMCHAWDIHESEKIPFRDSIKRGWEIVKSDCAELGVYSPEPVELEKSARIVDKETGQTVGIIALGKDDSVEVCIKDSPCYVSEPKNKTLFYISEAYYAGLGFGIAPEAEKD